MAKQRRRDAELAQFENRKQLLRSRRDREEAQQANRMLVALTIGLGTFLAFGMFRELYQKPNTPVAKVSGEVITAATFGKRIQYARQQLIVTLQNFRDLASSSSGDFLKNFAEQSRTRLPETTLDQLINEALIRQEAQKRGITITEADGDQRIRDELATAIAPQPTVVPEESGEATAVPDAGTTGATTDTVASAVTSTLGAALTGTTTSSSTVASAPSDTTASTSTISAAPSDSTAGGPTSAAGSQTGADDPSPATSGVSSTDGVSSTEGLTATNGATPTVSAKAIDSAYKSRIDPMLQTTGLTKADYRSIIMQVAYRDKLQELIANEVPITDKQVEAEYLIFEQEDGAKAAIVDLGEGATWESLRTKYMKPSDETTEPASGDASATAPETTTTGAAPIAVTPVTSTSGVSRTYALDISDRKWYTSDGLKSSWGASDSDAAKVMALKATSSLTEPIKGTQGFYVTRVFTVDPTRKLTDEELKTRKDGALDKWLEKAKTIVKIDRFPTEAYTPAEPEWFTTNFDAIANVTVPTISVPPISLPTSPPAAP